MLDKYNKAYKYYKLCLDLRLQIYKGDHRDVAMIYENMGLLYFAR